MMNAILMAVVRFFETVVNYSLGAVLITLGVVGTLTACRWLLAGRSEDGQSCRSIAMLRKGSGSLALAAVLAVGLGCVLAGLSVWAR
jgi:hypothetical protein